MMRELLAAIHDYPWTALGLGIWILMLASAVITMVKRE